jgi:hypothetical protein
VRSTNGVSSDVDEMHRIYERYGKPFEGEHWGEFLAVSTDGRTLLAPTLHEALREGFDSFGPGNAVFKVGERTVGKI